MIDPSSVALGATISLIGWGIFIFGVFYPKINGLKIYFEEKEILYMKKIDNILEGKDQKFNAILDDKLPEITDKILERFSNPEDPKMRNVIMNVAGGAYYAIVSDPDIKRSIQGHINGYLNGAVGQIEDRIGFKEQDVKDLRELITFFNANKEKLGMLAGGQGGNQGGVFNPLQTMMAFMPGMGQQ